LEKKEEAFMKTKLTIEPIICGAFSLTLSPFTSSGAFFTSAISLAAVARRWAMASLLMH
jgi:hypothetical protein